MKRTEIPSRTAIPLPFALNGETSIPVKELDPFLDSGNLGALGFDGKYQWNGNTAPSRFITRQLMNKLFGQISGRQFLRQCGAIDSFDRNVCKSIGGYPKGAVLQYLDGNVLYDVVSLVDNNMIDYTEVGIDGENWGLYGSSLWTYVYPDYGTTGAENIIGKFTISNSVIYNDAELADGTKGPVTVTSQCWIHVISTNPTFGAGVHNHNYGIVLYGASTSKPNSIDDLDAENPQYTVYEIGEIGTVQFLVIPALPGTKISAFSNPSVSEGSTKIILRRLTPIRME